VLAASSIAIALHLFPLWAVATVLVCDCGLHHLTRAADGDWWSVGDTVRTGMGLRLVDTSVNTVLWMLAHACPLLRLRDPNFIGPHCMARIVICSFAEGAFVIVTALALPAELQVSHAMNATLLSHSDKPSVTESSAHAMTWRICLPAMCVALVALATFFASMEPCYRRTFFVRDTRRAMYHRHWAEWAEAAHGDEDRAYDIGDGTLLRYVGEPVVMWIEQCVAQWALSPPAWCTAVWKAAVNSSMHASCQAVALHG
jgi:hypothetical protein